MVRIRTYEICCDRCELKTNICNLNISQRLQKISLEPGRTIMVLLAALRDCVCEIYNCIIYSNPSGINTAVISIFYTIINSTDADAKSP